MKKITCVIFDFGGVIGLAHSEKYIQEMIELSGVSREVLLAEYFNYRKDYDQGFTDTKTYWTQILAGKNVDLTDELVEKLLYADASSWTQINNKTVDYMYKLKQEGIRVVLLSNINYGALAFIEKHYKFLELFDDKFYSCDMKLLKPNPKIYEEVVSGLGIEASTCLFIDDTLENVKGAKAIGMESEQFIEIESLIKTINEKYQLIRNE